MEEFNELNKVVKLFEEKNCPTNNGIFLALLKDSRKSSGMIGGMEYPYSGLLLDITDEGIGYFYLNQPKISLSVKLEKLVVDKNSYTFINKDDIVSIEVKKFALLDKKRKELIIKTNDKKTHYLYGQVEDSLIPYHNENMAKLIEKYEKK